MEDRILGLHHITAIAGDAQTNFEFYTKVLGIRLVKKTVNFDDPGTYHLYYGDEQGSPGSILTFFPWGGQKGRPGVGMATEISYSVPAGSLDFWTKRLQEAGVSQQPVSERFGERYLSFEDPDGLQFNLVEATLADDRKGWITNGLTNDVATKGFHSIVLTVRNSAATAKVLTDVFGYRPLGQEGDRFRFITDAYKTANIVDIVEDQQGKPGLNSAGTNHHVAFRVKDDNILMELREKVIKAGLRITEKIDRNYFYSLYFREPGGVLFEIATDNPGFDVDESLNELGTHLMLPQQYEESRREIEAILPVLQS
jgi:glyoxalase family protein